MPESYPYIISNNKIEPILAKIRSAAKPDRFSQDLLKKYGFTASNDRAMVAVLRGLGFITENGTPTEYFDRLRDPNEWKYVLGERVRALYSDLYALDTDMHKAPENEIKGAISRVTGKDDKSVGRYFTTFKTLASLARFDARLARRDSGQQEAEKGPEEDKPAEERREEPADRRYREPDFHYNIQIHLPVTTDVSVYNAIFRSLKEHLSI